MFESRPEASDLYEAVRKQAVEAHAGVDPLAEAADSMRFIDRLTPAVAASGYLGTVMATHPNSLLVLSAPTAVIAHYAYRVKVRSNSIREKLASNEAAMADHGHIAEIVGNRKLRTADLIWHGFSEEAGLLSEPERRAKLTELGHAAMHAKVGYVLIPQDIARQMFPDSQDKDGDVTLPGAKNITLQEQWRAAGLKASRWLNGNEDSYEKFETSAFVDAVRTAGELQEYSVRVSAEDIIQILRKRNHPVVGVWDRHQQAGVPVDEQALTSVTRAAIERRGYRSERRAVRLPNGVVVGEQLELCARLDRTGPRYAKPAMGRLSYVQPNGLEHGSEHLRTSAAEVAALVTRLRDRDALTDAEVGECEIALYLLLTRQIPAELVGIGEGVGATAKRLVLPQLSEGQPTWTHRVLKGGEETLDKGRPFRRTLAGISVIMTAALGGVAAYKYDERHTQLQGMTVVSAETRIANAKYKIDDIIAYLPDRLMPDTYDGSSGLVGGDGNSLLWQIDGNGHDTSGYWTTGVANRYELRTGAWQYLEEAGRWWDEYEIRHTMPTAPDKAQEAEDLIKVTGQPEWWDEARIVNIPVLQGTEPVAASFSGLPVDMLQQPVGTYALQLRDMGSGGQKELVRGNVTYWLRPQANALQPHAATERQIVASSGRGREVYNKEIIAAWERVTGTSFDFSKAGDARRAKAMRETFAYNPHAYNEFRDSDYRWHVKGEYVDDMVPVITAVMRREVIFCEPANTALALGSPRLNLATGFMNREPHKQPLDTLSSRESHAWTVDAAGKIIDATPPDKTGQYEEYFSEDELEAVEVLPTIQERESRKKMQDRVLIGSLVMLGMLTAGLCAFDKDIRRKQAIRRLRRRSDEQLAEDKAVADAALYAPEIILTKIPSADYERGRSATTKALFDRRTGAVTELRRLNRFTYHALARRAITRARRTMRDLDRIHEADLERIAERHVRFARLGRAGTKAVKA